MTLCFGTLAKVLNLCKPGKNNPIQRDLLNAILSTVYEPYTSAGIQDTDSTKLLNCTQSVKPDVRNSARQLIAEGKIEEAVSSFQKKVITPKFIKTDMKTKHIIEAAIKDIIGRDSTISDDVVIDIVNNKTKKALLEKQGECDFTRFITGVFLYTIVNVENKINPSAKTEDDVAEVKGITTTYIEKFATTIPDYSVEVAAELAPEIKVERKNEVPLTVEETAQVIYNDTSRWFPFGLKKRRFQCLTNEYTNVSSIALKTIMQKYVQQRVKCLSIRLSRDTKSDWCIVKDLLKCLKNNSLLLIGKAGYGKSTALRWLFLNSRDKCAYVRMCNLNAYSPNAIMKMLKETLKSKQLVFLDGVDESSACISNKNFIKEITDWLFKNNIRFAISTRADHFDGIDALLHRYFSKNTVKHRGGLAVFEMEGFLLEQFVQAAMILKHLQKKDATHFKNKYPMEKRTNENKKELEKAFSGNVFFQAPVFSRYAFVLIDAAQGGLTLTKAIEKIIRWECHDYLKSGSDEQNSKAFEFYQNVIFTFLENVAFSMKNADSLEPVEYKRLVRDYIENPLRAFIESKSMNDEMLRRECIEMKENAALCLLSKSEKGERVSFEHSVFKDFFIARRLANTNLREDETCRELFYVLSESNAFIDSYTAQLIANKKFEVLPQRIKPRRTYGNADMNRLAFVEDVFRFFTDPKGVELLPGMSLTPLAELFPNVRINFTSSKKISPVWLEIYDLRQEGLIVEPASPISNAREIALAFCKDNGTIPESELDIVRAVYQLHTEFFAENDTTTINYIALIYSRMMQKIYYSDTDGESYRIMNELAKVFREYSCETSRYFCNWFAELLSKRGNNKNSTSWAKHALRDITSVPIGRSLRVSVYKQILKNSVFESDWVEFNTYYEALITLGEKLDFYLSQYRVAQLIKTGEYEEALAILSEHKTDSSENYYFIYLKATCMNRLQSWEDFENMISKIEKLIEVEKDNWHKCRLNCMKMDLLISYYNLHKNEEQLLETAKKATAFYTEWKSSSISKVQYIIDSIEKGEYAFDTLVEPGVWA